MGFTKLGLSQPILQAITEQGYSQPSAIQEQAIPAVLKGHDVMAAAQTGTGKTAGFTLPMLELLSAGRRAKSNHIRALVLTPTRELAAQVGESVDNYGRHLSLKSTIVYGGVKINPQMQKLRSGADILIATPGRLLDLYGQNAIKFEDLELLVLDEADRMLDMGFIHDIKKIINLLPKKRQNLLFSATFSNEIRALAKGLVNDPVEISVTPPNTTVEKIEQSIITVDKSRKTQLLIKLIKQHNWFQVLVFSRTKHGANRLAKKLVGNGIPADAIHGDKRQNARLRALADFKANKTQVLVATDIAARGIDIDLLPHVVNFDLPHVAEDYVHRIGRTGRAGQDGEAVSFVCAEEFDQLVDIEHLINELLPRQEVKGFEPQEPVPETRLGMRKPKKIKKPKKPKNTSNNASGSNAGANQKARAKKPSQGRNTKQGNNPKQSNNSKPKSHNNNTKNNQNSQSPKSSKSPKSEKPSKAFKQRPAKKNNTNKANNQSNSGSANK